MTERRSQDSHSIDPFSVELERALERRGDAPDLTGPIMHALGYAHLSARQTRRRRQRRWAQRAMLASAAVLAAATGVHLFKYTPSARTVVGPTLSDAIQTDLQRQGRRLDTFLRQMQSLSAPAPAATYPVAPPDETPVEQPRFDERIDDAIDRSAAAPMKWV